MQPATSVNAFCSPQHFAFPLDYVFWQNTTLSHWSLKIFLLSADHFKLADKTKSSLNYRLTVA